MSLGCIISAAEGIHIGYGWLRVGGFGCVGGWYSGECSAWVRGRGMGCVGGYVRGEGLWLGRGPDTDTGVEIGDL